MSLISVVGSLNVDVSYRVRMMPVPGETVLAVDRARSFGGKGGNQAVAAAALGAEVQFVGAVGQDEQGLSYLQHLSGLDVDVAGVAQLEGSDTGTAMILVDDSGENLIVVEPGANALLDGLWVRHVLSGTSAKVVLAQLEVPVAALEAAAAVIAGDAVLVLNPAPMPPDGRVLENLLRRVDVLVPNRKELGQLAGEEEPRTLAQVRECLDSLAFEGSVVVTLGSDGAMVREPGSDPEHLPALRVEPVDTTGAGDAFCGALAFGIARGRTLRESVESAIEVAGRSTLHRGAQPDPAAHPPGSADARSL
ncbi:ribokinase [Terrabacter sp. NPDC080008]|uniref:ribokinase n=1 Tax=Terrabacter sp. NPDC080008 TaxID=3155176 RepID=UPI00344B5847